MVETVRAATEPNAMKPWFGVRQRPDAFQDVVSELSADLIPGFGGSGHMA